MALGPGPSLYLERRAPEGLLGGMTEVPGTRWTAREDGATDLSGAPFAADWQPAGTVKSNVHRGVAYLRAALDAAVESLLEAGAR